MNWKTGQELTEDQRDQPVLWRRYCESIQISKSTICTLVASAFPDGKKSKSLKTWGRDREYPNGPHWIGVRNGTTLHIDPRYPRYTHQLVVHNVGWYVSGIKQEIDSDPFIEGTLFCLDTHSPHILLRDTRLGEGLFYLALSMDSSDPIPDSTVVRELSRFAANV